MIICGILCQQCTIRNANRSFFGVASFSADQRRELGWGNGPHITQLPAPIPENRCEAAWCVKVSWIHHLVWWGWHGWEQTISYLYINLALLSFIINMSHIKLSHGSDPKEEIVGPIALNLTIYKVLLWVWAFQKRSKCEQPCEKWPDLRWEKDDERLTKEDGWPDCSWKSIPQGGTNACKGSELRSWNKEV